MLEHLKVRTGERWGMAGFDQAFPGMELVAAGAEGTATLRMPLSEAVHNTNGTLHGGAIATLVDIAGTLALIALDKDGRPGVTTDLNVSYFNAGNGTVLATARVLKLGRTLGVITCDLVREADGTPVAQGRMTKYMPPATAAPKEA